MLVKILVTMVTIHSRLINQLECATECAQIQLCVCLWIEAYMNMRMDVIVCCRTQNLMCYSNSMVYSLVVLC